MVCGSGKRKSKGIRRNEGEQEGGRRRTRKRKKGRMRKGEAAGRRRKNVVEKGDDR